MNILEFIRRPSASGNKPTVVVFAGGMGAQIINAAVYFSLRNAGCPVFANLAYFDNAEKLAVVGNAGQLTHWGWQLNVFGLTPASFETKPQLNKRNAELLQDGLRMLKLGLDGLAQRGIQDIFKVPAGVTDILPTKIADRFLCIHMRRGDFVNVASHLIADNEFLELARKFSGLVRSVVVVSDSPIGSDFRGAVSSFFKEVLFLDDIGAFDAHRIMRGASILVCSNSTFSLTAAALNPDALVVVPKQWYGGKHREMEAAINSRCSFQIMENVRIQP